MGSQHFEHAIEPNRRLDPPVADEYLAKILMLLSERAGKIFVAADDADHAVGWGIVVEKEDDIFVVAEERRYAYIAELFVVEPLRGSGVGRALIEAVYERAKAAGSTRVYWQTHETNQTAMKLYDQVADRSGFVVYRKAL